ncbi:hypothetical protein [Streptomyces niveus]|uniref:hypothetical protein n=1 Tax=Streptomyces niveus TaxID=193462 RepID=UPI00386E886A
MTAAVILAALSFGYGIGRWQPWARLGDWADWQVRFHLGRWNRTRPRQALLFAVLLFTDPAHTVQAWRHRNDPPEPRSPALKLKPRDPA